MVLPPGRASVQHRPKYRRADEPNLDKADSAAIADRFPDRDTQRPVLLELACRALLNPAVVWDSGRFSAHARYVLPGG